MKFPVLCLSRDTGIFFATTPAHLAATRVSAQWTDRVYSGMKIVDASGACFLVRSYKVEKPKTPMFRKLAEFLELKRELRLQVEPTAPVELSELKAAVLHSIDEDAESFEELSGKSTSWWHAQLNRASSCLDVLDSFARAESAA